MNKYEMVSYIMEQNGMTRTEALQQVDQVFNLIIEQLKSGEDVKIRNFGTFKLTTRKAKTITNPKTGEDMYIPERVTPIFIVSERFKEKMRQADE